MSIKEEERLVNKDEKDDSSKKSNSFKEEFDERLKSIEKSMDYTWDNSLVDLAKKIEILNSPIEIEEMKKDIIVLEITKLSDNNNEKPNDRLKILFVINVKNMDILRNNV